MGYSDDRFEQDQAVQLLQRDSGGKRNMAALMFNDVPDTPWRAYRATQRPLPRRRRDTCPLPSG